jgi:uncharacterized protein YybS (DUF2232 family)
MVWIADCLSWRHESIVTQLIDLKVDHFLWIVCFEPLLSIFCFLTVETQIDRFVVLIVVVGEDYFVLLHVVEVFSCFFVG